MPIAGIAVRSESMKVILLKDVPNVGKQQQILDVKTGYANNFLFAKGLAVPANEENMKILEEQIAAQKALEAQIKAEAVDMKNTIQNKTVTLKTKSGPDGKLYGAVTSKDIADAMHKALGVEIDKRKILTDAIKITGTYTVKIKLHPEVDAAVNVTVENE